MCIVMTLFNLRDILKNSCSISLAIARRLNSVEKMRTKFVSVKLRADELHQLDTRLQEEIGQTDLHRLKSNEIQMTSCPMGDYVVITVAYPTVDELK